MIKTVRRLVLTGLTLALAAGPAAADPTTFHFNPGGLNQAIFQSEAPLETITGTNNGVSGEVTVDLADPSAATGTITLDASGFRTGIEHRDNDLAGENWIDAAAFPQVTFELTGVTIDGPLDPATPRSATVTGNLTFHGVTNAVSATAEVGYYEVPEEQRNPMLGITGNALRIEASFPVTLADYGITVPPVLDLKVAPEISIEMRLTGLDTPPG